MLSKGSVDAAHHAVRLFNTFPKQFYISWKMHQAFITVGICIDCLKILYVWVPAISGGGNLAASKIRNLECPSYGLKDYGCGKFIRKYIFLDLRSWEINIARTARRLGVSRNTVRHLQSLSSEEVLQQKERHYKLHAYEQAVASLLISLPSISSSRIGDYLREHYPDFPHVCEKTVHNYVQFIRKKHHIPPVR